MGLYAPGAADEAFIDWIYVSCSQTTGGATTDGACPFVMPVDVPPCVYEVRLFANAATGQYTPLAVSNAFTVTAPDGPLRVPCATRYLFSSSRAALRMFARP